MLIDEIVSFCNSQYSHADTEHICESCQHEECPQSCKKCLEEIHYPYRYPNGKKDYDCCNLIYFRFLYKGIIIKHNKTEPTYTKTSLFLCEKRRFFMGRTEKGGKVF